MVKQPIVFAGSVLFILGGWFGIIPIAAQPLIWDSKHTQISHFQPNLKPFSKDLVRDSILNGRLKSFSCMFIPPWSPSELPVFCRMEHILEKRTAVPIKFRLGAVQYVDWLEGKPNSGIYPWYIP